MPLECLWLERTWELRAHLVLRKISESAPDPPPSPLHPAQRPKLERSGKVVHLNHLVAGDFGAQ